MAPSLMSWAWISRKWFLGPDSWGLVRARPGSGMAWDGKVSFRVHETLLFPTPADLQDLVDLGKMVPEPVLRPSLPHAPGVRMTVVQNKLPQKSIAQARQVIPAPSLRSEI